MSAPESSVTRPLVACLCAAWCGSCRDYRGTFEALAASFAGRNLADYDRNRLPTDQYVLNLGGANEVPVTDLFGFSTAVESYEYSKYHMNMLIEQTSAGLSLANGPVVAKEIGATTLDKLRNRAAALMTSAGTDIGGFATLPAPTNNPLNYLGFAGLWPIMAPFTSFDSTLAPTLNVVKSCTFSGGYGGIGNGTNYSPQYECVYNSLHLPNRDAQVEKTIVPGVLGFATWKEALWAIDFAGRIHDVAGNQLKSLAPLVARLPKLKQLSFSENALGRGEKKQLDAMMRVAPSKRATMAGAPVAQSGKDQPHPTFLGQATSINSSIMLMVGDASIAARWRGTDNATSGDTDGSDWDTAFKAKWKGGGAKMCVTVPFSGGELQNLDVGGMGGMVEVFRVGEHLVLVEGVFEEHERKHADFLAYVAEPPAKKAKNTSSVTIKSGVIAFVPAPSSGERITKNLGKLNANGSREFDTESESAVIAKLAKGTYEIWREPEVERSWGEAARVIVKR